MDFKPKVGDRYKHSNWYNSVDALFEIIFLVDNEDEVEEYGRIGDCKWLTHHSLTGKRFSLYKSSHKTLLEQGWKYIPNKENNIIKLLNKIDGND